MKRGIVLVALGTGLLVLMALSAGAQGNKLHATLTCDGTSYDVSVPGNGNNTWSPAQDNSSNLTFHPTAFGEFSGTFTPKDGSDPVTVTEPPEEFAAHPQNHNEHPTIDCTVAFTVEDETSTFVGTGSLTGWTSAH